MMRDLFREGRNIDAARVRTEHDRKRPALDVLVPTRGFPWAHIFRAVFGYWAVRCRRHR